MIKKVLIAMAVASFSSAFADDAKKPSEEVLKKAIENGKAAYATCAACHQPTGAGLPNVFPSLVKSDWVNKLDNKTLASIIIRGLSGPNKINGKDFPGNAPMAPLGAALDDQKIADVLTYVKNSFENDGGFVSPEEVKAARAESTGKPMLTMKDIKFPEEKK